MTTSFIIAYAAMKTVELTVLFLGFRLFRRRLARRTPATEA